MRLHPPAPPPPCSARHPHLHRSFSRVCRMSYRSTCPSRQSLRHHAVPVPRTRTHLLAVSVARARVWRVCNMCPPAVLPSGRSPALPTDCPAVASTRSPGCRLRVRLAAACAFVSSLLVWLPLARSPTRCSPACRLPPARLTARHSPVCPLAHQLSCPSVCRRPVRPSSSPCLSPTRAPVPPCIYSMRLPACTAWPCL